VLPASIIGLLDQLLLVLLIVELLYTVHVSFREHVLTAPPFLLVALIAAVRRILVLTAEAKTVMEARPKRSARWSSSWRSSPSWRSASSSASICSARGTSGPQRSRSVADRSVATRHPENRSSRARARRAPIASGAEHSLPGSQ